MRKTFDKSNHFSKHAQICEFIVFHSRRSILEKMTQEERIEFYSLADAVSHHANRCNYIAKKI